MSNSKLMLPITGLLISFLLLVWFPAASQQSSFSSPETSNPASDTIFRQATNSPGYLVVKKADWDRLRKIWSDSLKLNSDLLEKEKTKYLAKLDSIEQIPSATTPVETEKEPAATSTASSDSTTLFLGLGLAFFVLYGGVTTFRLYSQNTGLKSQTERLDQIEKDFDQHKKSSIERERKLMRELIDTQNELAEEKAKQSSDSE